LAQFEILARAFKSEVDDYIRQSMALGKKFDALERSFTTLSAAVERLTKHEFLEKLDDFIDTLDRAYGAAEEVSSYGMVAISRGRDIVRRFPVEAHKADIDLLISSLNKMVRLDIGYKAMLLDLKQKALRMRMRVLEANPS